MHSVTKLLAVAAVLSLSACAPSLPGPPPDGAATLSADMRTYDDITFPTNRKPVVQPDDECSIFDDRVRVEAGYPSQPDDQGDTNGSSPGCELSLSEDHYDPGRPPPVSLAAAREPFEKYWKNEPPRYLDDNSPASMYHAEQFHRFTLDGRYFAVEITNDLTEFECYVVVNTGSSVSLSFATKQDQDSDMNANTSDPGCRTARKVASATVRTADPGGGSIASD